MGNATPMPNNYLKLAKHGISMNVNPSEGYNQIPIAAFPEYSYIHRYWYMRILKCDNEGYIAWFDHYIEYEGRYCGRSSFESFKVAYSAATKLNQTYISELVESSLPKKEIQSLILKASKTVQIKSRSKHEEELMKNEAVSKNENCGCAKKSELVLPIESEAYREDLHAQLLEMPYLQIVLLNSSQHPYIMILKKDGSWSKPYLASSKQAKVAYRSKIANGFGFLGTDHWGKTKAAIRTLLLPRANRLLELASVHRLLADALLQGKKVLVCGAYIFWYEEDGDVGWQIKTVSTSQSSSSAVLWEEGTVLSKNHGRIIILPYKKEDGTLIQGHTKNSSSDGRATPRHPTQYVTLPFEILKDDLMIGLFGELPYE